MINRIKEGIPEGYYEQIAGRRVNKVGHAAARGLVCGATALARGRLIVEAHPSAQSVEQPVILSPTHRSAADIWLSFAAASRIGIKRPRTIAKRSLFKRSVPGWFLHANGGFAVDRDRPDTDAIMDTFDAILSDGQNIQFYPEGKRVKTDTRRVQKLKGGVITIASRSGRPILPMGIAGTAEDDRSLPYGMGLPNVAVIGEPLFVPDVSDVSNELQAFGIMRDARSVLHDSMQACLDRAYEIREANPGLLVR